MTGGEAVIVPPEPDQVFCEAKNASNLFRLGLCHTFPNSVGEISLHIPTPFDALTSSCMEICWAPANGGNAAFY